MNQRAQWDDELYMDVNYDDDANYNDETYAARMFEDDAKPGSIPMLRIDAQYEREAREKRKRAEKDEAEYMAYQQRLRRQQQAHMMTQQQKELLDHYNSKSKSRDVQFVQAEHSSTTISDPSFHIDVDEVIRVAEAAKEATHTPQPIQLCDQPN
jgi:Na+-translocating ferredoxin:NAD+ oxidoreductase RnfC subunit